MRRLLPFDYAVLNLARRPARTLLTAFSCALVAGLLVASTAFVRGLERSYAGTAEPDTAILLNAASMKDVVRSAVALAVADHVAADVATVKKIDGEPAVSPEIHLATWLRVGGAGGGSDLADEPKAGFVRGVTSRAFLVHPAVTLIDGRPAESDDEVIVGRLAADRLEVPAAALAPGQRLRFEGGEFTIVGTFAAPGTTFEAEVWAPLQRLKGLSKRDDISAVFVRVEGAAGFRELEHFAARRRDLELLCMTSASYYGELAAYFGPLRLLAWSMAVLIGLAALLTGANTLNAAVQERTKELATLRTLGYRGFALVTALLQESLVLAAAGGLLGLLLARVALAGSSVRLAMSAFTLAVDSTSITTGLAGALALGLLGTLPAAMRVLRLPVARALQGE
ncbi:MAG: FtsX-like permease family protein [Planctomycetes bacterium]|nr:FtsX-like permease family protein [Planctomycetota bacterium]